MLLKCCTRYASKFGKLSSGHGTGKDQSFPVRLSFWSQRKEMPKGVQTMVQLCSFHKPVRLCSQPFRLGFSSTWTENFQMYKLGSEKAGNQRLNCQHWLDHGELKGVPKNIYFYITDYTKAFDYVDHNKLWKILKETGIQTTLPVSWETCMEVKKQQLESDMDTMDWFKIGKGVRQGCVLSPCLSNFYAEYIMRNSWLDESQAGIKIARRNINNLRYADDTILMAEKWRETKEPLDEGERRVKRLAWNSTFKKTKIISSNPIT